MVTGFEKRFAEWVGMPHCRAVSSGTAAFHCAVAAIDPEPGDEIVTTPITDMGALTPILYQTAIPVFADVDPRTYQVTAETIAKKLTRRTRAIVVTHLFGNACDMDPILELATRHGLPVIEDCAQAFGTTYRGRHVGTLGHIGCFSLQQGKHMTTGEGGMVVTRDPALFRRMVLFSDKAWGYGDAKPDHYFVAPNYRMTELCGAVALAQIEKLDRMIEARVRMADRLTAKIAGLPGVEAPLVPPGVRHTYWKYPLHIDPAVDPRGRGRVRRAAQGRGGLLRAPLHPEARLRVRGAARPAHVRQEPVPLRGRAPEGRSRGALRRPETPGTVEALARVVVLPWNERYTDEHVDFIAGVIRDAQRELSQ